jgi:hypothetical protein
MIVQHSRYSFASNINNDNPRVLSSTCMIIRTKPSMFHSTIFEWIYIWCHEQVIVSKNVHRMWHIIEFESFDIVVWFELDNARRRQTTTMNQVRCVLRSNLVLYVCIGLFVCRWLARTSNESILFERCLSLEYDRFATLTTWIKHNRLFTSRIIADDHDRC